MQDYRAIVDRIRGPLAPIFPAFTADERLDLDSTCKWADWVVEQGIPLLWLGRAFSTPMKVLLSVLATLYTAVILWLFWLIMLRCYHHISEVDFR